MNYSNRPHLRLYFCVAVITILASLRPILYLFSYLAPINMGFFNEYIKISPLPLVFLDEEMYTKKRIKFTTEDKDISFDFTDKPRPFIINKAYYKIFVFSEDHVKRYGFKFYRQIFCENINQFDIPQLMNQKIQSMTISYFDINSNLKKELKILCQ